MWESPPACRWLSGRWWLGSGSRPAAPPPRPPCSPSRGVRRVRLGAARSRPPEALASASAPAPLLPAKHGRATQGHGMTPSAPPGQLQHIQEQWHHKERRSEEHWKPIHILPAPIHPAVFLCTCLHRALNAFQLSAAPLPFASSSRSPLSPALHLHSHTF